MIALESIGFFVLLPAALATIACYAKEQVRKNHRKGSRLPAHFWERLGVPNRDLSARKSKGYIL